MKRVLVTGAGRGLGLAFAKRYAAAGCTVIATVRHERAADELKRLPGDVQIVELDVTRPGSVERLAHSLHAAPLDLLINNAGVKGPEEPMAPGADVAAWREVFEVNVFGTVRVTLGLLPHLERGERTVVTLTSRLGSIAENREGGSGAYRASKAALNAAMRTLAAELAERRFTVVVITPGWVRTDMGGPDAPLSPDESVGRMVETIGRLSPEMNGRFLDFDGAAVPW